MNVYEIKIKVYLLQDVSQTLVSKSIAAFIDSALSKDEELFSMHNENTYKMYCFDQLAPIEKDGTYKKDTLYTFRIRTISAELSSFFLRVLKDHITNDIKGLVSEIREIPKKPLERVFTLSPLIIKTENGYWKETLTFEEYENRLKINLIKKYNHFFQTKLDENFALYNRLEFVNRKPVAFAYKNVSLLGDKLTIYPEMNQTAQTLWYLALGVGLGEMGARGAGFLGYRYM